MKFGQWGAKMTYPARTISAKDLEELARQMSEELREIENETRYPAPGLGITLPELNVAPKKPRTGLTVLADGTNWNPGAGRGVYTYYNALWNRLG